MPPFWPGWPQQKLQSWLKRKPSQQFPPCPQSILIQVLLKIHRCLAKVLPAPKHLSLENKQFSVVIVLDEVIVLTRFLLKKKRMVGRKIESPISTCAVPLLSATKPVRVRGKGTNCSLQSSCSSIKGLGPGQETLALGNEGFKAKTNVGLARDLPENLLESW